MFAAWCGRYTNKAFGYGSVVTGGHYNNVGSIVDDAVLNITFATGAYGFVGAGWGNTAQGHYTSVVGGNSNTARGSYSNIAGGYANSAHGYAATIGGGHVNTAGGATEIAGNYATIGGGWGNEAFGHFTGMFLRRSCNSGPIRVVCVRQGLFFSSQPVVVFFCQ